MTPDEFNDLCNQIVNGLRGAPEIDTVDLITPADAEGTEPEIGVEVRGTPLVLVVAPV